MGCAVSVTLSELVEQLQNDVPARDSVPTVMQYEQAVKDAVRDYSRRRPMQRFTTLSIVSGTAAYALPDDFVSVIRLDVPVNDAGVLHTASGLVPLSQSFDERWTVNGRTMTFTPTPTYSLARYLWYAAGHVLNVNGAYPDMEYEDAAMVMLKAQALALRAQAFSLVTSGTGDIVEYAIGDERVKKGSPVTSLQAMASSLESEYLAAIRQANGTVGSRARYDATGILI